MRADLQNGIITGYNITYQSLTENDNGFVQAGPNDRQANLTELKEFVEYNISVVAFTVKGDGPPFVFIVRTDQDSKSYNTFIIIIIITIIIIIIVIIIFIMKMMRKSRSEILPFLCQTLLSFFFINIEIIKKG